MRFNTHSAILSTNKNKSRIFSTDPAVKKERESQFIKQTNTKYRGMNRKTWNIANCKVFFLNFIFGTEKFTCWLYIIILLQPDDETIKSKRKVRESHFIKQTNTKYRGMNRKPETLLIAKCFFFYKKQLPFLDQKIYMLTLYYYFVTAWWWNYQSFELYNWQKSND